MSRLDEVRQRLELANPGPWVTEGRDYTWEGVTTRNDMPGWTDAGGDPVLTQNYEFITMRPDTIAFIEQAPADVTWLVQRVTDLERTLAEAREAAAQLDANAHAPGHTLKVDWAARQQAATARLRDALGGAW